MENPETDASRSVQLTFYKSERETKWREQPFQQMIQEQSDIHRQKKKNELKGKM